MSKRRQPMEKRCPRCRINKKLCFCDHIVENENKVKVTIIMHHREEHLTTNTATLAIKTLKNSKIVLRGLPEKPFTYADLEIENDEIPLYLFPTDDAIEIGPEFLESVKGKKLHLIVPDGTWNQAKKVYRREHDLHQIQCVKIPMGITSQYRLRKAPREDGVCTYEAISYALKELESNELHEQLMKTFLKMVEQFITSRYTYPND